MFAKLYNKLGGTWIFVIFVSFLYLLTLLFNPNIFFNALKESLNTLINWLWIFALIFALMVLTDLFITKKIVMKFFNGNNQILSWILIIIGGIISTGPIYMWYPILSELSEKGLKKRFITGFLYNRSIKIPLIIPMIAVFSDTGINGIKIITTLFIVMIAFSIINGYTVEFILNKLNKTNNLKTK